MKNRLAVSASLAFMCWIGATSNTAAYEERIAFRTPLSWDPCISACVQCNNPVYLQWSEVAIILDSKLEDYQACSGQVTGGCWMYDDCSPNGGFAEVTEGDLMREVWVAATDDDVQTLRSIIAARSDIVQFNRARHAVQVLDCTGSGIALSVPVSNRTFAALSD